MEYVEIESELITVQSTDIMSLLGEEQGEIDSHTKELINKYITLCKKAMNPRGAYIKIKAVESDSNEEIQIESGHFKTGKIIHKMLRKSEMYVFFMVTAGPDPESLARTLLEEGQYLEGYIVDLIGSAIVESAAHLVHEQIRRTAFSMGLRVTNRYSPGYCAWEVAEQQKLFKLFPDKCCGIELSESSLMLPIKSVSGVVGIGSEVLFNDNTCEICPMKNCIYRKLRS